MDFDPKSWTLGIWDFCPGILVPGFGVPEVRGPDFKSLSSRHAASGGSKFSKMTPPEFQRSFRLHFWQLSGHKTPNHHTLKMKSALWDMPKHFVPHVGVRDPRTGYFVPGCGGWTGPGPRRRLRLSPSPPPPSPGGSQIPKSPNPKNPLF